MAKEDSVLYMAKRIQVVWLAVCCVVAMVVVFLYAPDDWGLIRKVLGGLVTGSWAFFCLFINRILLS